MASLDARKLDHATLEEIRIRAVQQVQAGESPEAVIRALGFSSRCIYSWLAMYRAGGWSAPYGLIRIELSARCWRNTT